QALSALLRASLLAPCLALRRCVRLGPGAVFGPGGWTDHDSPLTGVYRGFTGLYPDGWAGPTYVTTFRVGPGDRILCLEGAPYINRLPRPFHIALTIDGREVSRHDLPEHRAFSLEVPLDGLAPGQHSLTVASGPGIVPRDYLGIDDDRPLCFR